MANRITIQNIRCAIMILFNSGWIIPPVGDDDALDFMLGERVFEFHSKTSPKLTMTITDLELKAKEVATGIFTLQSENGTSLKFMTEKNGYHSQDYYQVLPENIMEALSHKTQLTSEEKLQAIWDWLLSIGYTNNFDEEPLPKNISEVPSSIKLVGNDLFSCEFFKDVDGETQIGLAGATYSVSYYDKKVTLFTSDGKLFTTDFWSKVKLTQHQIKCMNELYTIIIAAKALSELTTEPFDYPTYLNKVNRATYYVNTLKETYEELVALRQTLVYHAKEKDVPVDTLVNLFGVTKARIKELFGKEKRRLEAEEVKVLIANAKAAIPPAVDPLQVVSAKLVGYAKSILNNGEL
jgi:hypothetical protein